MEKEQHPPLAPNCPEIVSINSAVFLANQPGDSMIVLYAPEKVSRKLIACREEVGWRQAVPTPEILKKYRIDIDIMKWERMCRHGLARMGRHVMTGAFTKWLYDEIKERVRLSNLGSVLF